MTEPTNNANVELNGPKAGPGTTPRGTDAVEAEKAVLREANVPAGPPKKARRLSRRALIMRRFWRSAGAKIGVTGLALVILLAIFGPFFAKWDYWVSDDRAFLTAPDSIHWFGTNQGGFDMFAMTMEGLRKSLIIGFAVAFFVEVLAALIGSAAAYFGKIVEKVILWIIDLLLVIPSFLLIAIMSQHAGGGGSGSVWVLILLLTAFGWMLSARVVRAMTLSVVNLDYVVSARYMSVPPFTIIVKHVIPNIASYLIIDFTLGVVVAIMGETALSFFGFGVQKPETSLGTLLADGMGSATTSPWIFLAPAGVLVILLLCVNFIGDALRDAIDPSSKSGGQA